MLALPAYTAVSVVDSAPMNVSKHFPLATVPVQVCPLAAVTVTLPTAFVLAPLLTVK